MKIKFLVLIILILNCHIYASEKNIKKDKLKIAVLQVKNSNVTPGAARLIRNAIELYLFKTGNFDILERDQVDFIIKEKNLKFDEGDEKNSAAKIGSFISANYVVVGSIDRFNNYNITIKVVEVERSKIVITESVRISKLSKLNEESKNLAKKINKGILALGTGHNKMNFVPGDIYFEVGFSYLFPSGSFSESNESGYGATISCGKNGWIFDNITMGGTLGFFYFDGNGETTDHAVVLPMMLDFGYKYKINKFTLWPYLSFGAGYNSNYFYKYTSSPRVYKENELQAMSDIGFKVDYDLSEFVSFQLAAAGWQIYEENQINNFSSLGLTIEINF